MRPVRPNATPLLAPADDVITRAQGSSPLVHELRLRYTDVTMLLQLGPLLLTVIMVYYDGHLHVGHKRLYLMSELTGKGCIIMDGDIGDYID